MESLSNHHRILPARPSTSSGLTARDLDKICIRPGEGSRDLPYVYLNVQHLVGGHQLHDLQAVAFDERAHLRADVPDGLGQLHFGAKS